jgi:lipopolysaccharide transport system ATP-binding protein
MGVNRMGSMEAEVTDLRFVGHDTGPFSIGTGASLGVEIGYARHQPVETIVCSVAFVRDSKKVLVITCTCGEAGELPMRDSATLRLALGELPLTPGEYEVEVGLYPSDWRYAYDCHWDAYRVTVTGADSEGYLRVPATWTER